MPLYEYLCDACGHRFEVIQKFSDPPVVTCPLCGKGSIRKVQSAPAFQLKGTGWYKTDYPKKEGASSGKKDSDGSESSGGGKSEPAAAQSDSSPAPAPSSPPAKKD